MEQKVLHPGGDTSYVVIIHALGHCFGVFGSTMNSSSQRHCEQKRLGLGVETQVYSHGDRHSQRIVPRFAKGRHGPLIHYAADGYSNTNK